MKIKRATAQLGGAVFPLSVLAAILMFWEAAVRLLGIRAIILPAPSEIAIALFERRDLIMANLWPSLYLTILGFGLSVVVGVLLGVLITYSEFMRKGIYPVLVVSQVIPKMSLAPLLIVWFGTGHMSSLLLAFLTAFFPMTINSTMGFQSVDEDIYKMARSFMGSRWQIFWKIRMPNALPYIFGGMKISVTLAIIGVIVSEFVASQEGIGYLIKLSGGLLDTPLMMAAIVALSIVGLLLYWMVDVLERHAVYWQSPPDVSGEGGG